MAGRSWYSELSQILLQLESLLSSLHVPSFFLSSSWFFCAPYLSLSSTSTFFPTVMWSLYIPKLITHYTLILHHPISRFIEFKPPQTPILTLPLFKDISTDNQLLLSDKVTAKGTAHIHLIFARSYLLQNETKPVSHKLWKNLSF